MHTTPVRFLRVGGIVRDRLLGVPSKDEDFIVLGCPSFEQMLREIRAIGGQIFEGTERPEFGVVRGRLPEIGAADFALPRDDGFSSDGRRPDTVEIHDDLERDLARRDFTVNAMAEAEDGSIIDPFHGQADLEERCLRFVGEASERLQEDALRAFRGVRFSATKGFWLDTMAITAISDMQPDDFSGVSTERIREELHKAFHADTAATLVMLSHTFPTLLEVTLDRGLWLMPTVKS